MLILPSLLFLFDSVCLSVSVSLGHPQYLTAIPPPDAPFPGSPPNKSLQGACFWLDMRGPRAEPASALYKSRDSLLHVLGDLLPEDPEMKVPREEGV